MALGFNNHTGPLSIEVLHVKFARHILLRDRDQDADGSISWHCIVNDNLALGLSINENAGEQLAVLTIVNIRQDRLNIYIYIYVALSRLPLLRQQAYNAIRFIFQLFGLYTCSIIFHKFKTCVPHGCTFELDLFAYV